MSRAHQICRNDTRAKNNATSWGDLVDEVVDETVNEVVDEVVDESWEGDWEEIGNPDDLDGLENPDELIKHRKLQNFKTSVDGVVRAGDLDKKVIFIPFGFLTEKLSSNMCYDAIRWRLGYKRGSNRIPIATYNGIMALPSRSIRDIVTLKLKARDPSNSEHTYPFFNTVDRIRELVLNVPLSIACNVFKWITELKNELSTSSMSIHFHPPPDDSYNDTDSVIILVSNLENEHVNFLDQAQTSNFTVTKEPRVVEIKRQRIIINYYRIDAFSTASSTKTTESKKPKTKKSTSTNPFASLMDSDNDSE